MRLTLLLKTVTSLKWLSHELHFSRIESTKDAFQEENKTVEVLFFMPKLPNDESSANGEQSYISWPSPSAGGRLASLCWVLEKSERPRKVSIEVDSSFAILTNIDCWRRQRKEGKTKNIRHESQWEA